MERFTKIFIFAILCLPIGWCQFRLSTSNYVERQLLCALDQAPCDGLGRQIKDALPRIIGNNCAECSQREYAGVQRVTRFVQNRYPQVWDALVAKYSPPRN